MRINSCKRLFGSDRSSRGGVLHLSLPLEDPGADAAHGVGLTPQTVLGHVILQHPQPHGLAPDNVMNHDELQ